MAEALVDLHPVRIEVLDLLQDDVDDVALADLLPRGGVDHRITQNLVDFLRHLAEDLEHLGIHVVLVLLHLLFVALLLLLIEVRAAAEALGGDDHAFLAGRHGEAVVLHILARAAEDRVQQFFFGRQFALALGGHLAHQDVARLYACTHAHHAVLIQVAQGLLAHVGDIAGEFLATQLGLANFRVVVLNVDGGKGVVLDQTLGDEDSVLEVVAVEGHERDQEVAAQGQLAVGAAGAVRDDLILLDPLALANDGPLVQAGPLVEAGELAEDILLGVIDDDAFGVHIGNGTALAGSDDHAAVDGDVALHTRGHDRRFRANQRHGLALHVRTHQRAVGIVVLQERNQRGRHADGLLGGNIHVLDIAAFHQGYFAVLAGQLGFLLEGGPQLAAFAAQRLGGRQRGVHFLIGTQPLHILGDPGLLDDAVRRDQEAVFIDRAVNGQRTDQADVVAFGRLNGADAAVMADVYVADFKARTLAVQAARAQCRQAPLVRELAQRISLVDDLRAARCGRRKSRCSKKRSWS